MATKFCEMCGRKMENVKADRRFCRDCNQVRRKVLQRKYREQHSTGQNRKTVSPCRTCPEREIGCRSMCDRYIRYADHREKMQEKRDREAAADI